MMRKLLWLVILAGLGWTAYWFIGAQGVQAGAASWIEERRAEGWQVEHSDLAVRGFPNRFDTTFTDLSLTDPDTGVSWQAPFFQLFALSYQPNHLIAVWPNDQVIATPFQKISINSKDMRASLVVKAQSSLELDRAQIDMSEASFASNEGWTASVDALNIAIRETEATPRSYDLYVQTNTLAPGERFRALIDQGGRLPDIIEAITLDLVIGTDRPIDRSTIEDARPNITKLTINDARGTWGELFLRAKGEMEISESGTPEGRLDLNARNWRQMLELAVDAGAISPDAARAAEFGLGLLASSSGSSESLDAPLSFSGGRTFLGPIPIGPAPKIKLR